MEGVLDPLVRHLLTQINNYDLCITEFLRVTDTLLPKKSFYKICPELQSYGKTSSGTPVRIQLLGQSPIFLALNAYRALELGSHGIDLNCGCPSRFVNGHGGGAVLLKSPETIYQAVLAIASAIKDMPNNQFSVKIRLGWDDSTPTHEIVDAIESAGADMIFVHGRTKEDGYQADKIKWNKIKEIREQTCLQVVANGEIWSLQSAIECMYATGCSDLMIGRGALALPNIANVIKHNEKPMLFEDVIKLLINYFALEKEQDIKKQYHMMRTKQWLRYILIQYPEALELYQDIRSVKSNQTILDRIKQEITF